MARHFPSLLASPAQRAVRRLVRDQLASAAQAVDRLDPDEPEALHDFRVALRRARSLLRTYRELDLLSGKWRRRLRTLAQATNGARDVEVALRHLQGYGQDCDGIARWLSARLNAEKEAAYAAVKAEIANAWPPLAARLQELLADPGKNARGERFGETTERLAQEEWRHLQSLRTTLEIEWRDDTAHRLRLAGKRLRYLFEPLTGELPAAAPAIALLKTFQDRFGDYHDLGVLLGLMAESAAGEAAAHAHARVLGADSHFELAPHLCLARRVREERLRLAEQLRAAYLPSASPALQPVAEAIADLRKTQQRSAK